MRFSQILAKFAVSLFTREWIEIENAPGATLSLMPSPSLRGSGLKCIVSYRPFFQLQSPSLRGSGLKSYTVPVGAAQAPVSLFTREWIEILNNAASVLPEIASPSLRGSGLK